MPRLILFNTSYDDTGEGAPVAIGKGVTVKDGLTLPTEAERIADPELWPRNPPVRFRKTVPDCWISLTIREGRNRVVQREWRGSACRARNALALGTAGQMELLAAVAAVGPEREGRFGGGKGGIIKRVITGFLCTNAQPCAHVSRFRPRPGCPD
jgi:hypothetical protein